MKSKAKTKSKFLRNSLGFLAAILIVLYFYNRTAEAAWYGDSWGYRVKLTIDSTKVDADLTDFPVYVDLGNLPSTFHQHVNRTDGRDIRVTKADGITEVPREVSFYDYTNRKGELHFKYSGTLSGSTDTAIYIYYGNPSASDYAATDTYGRNNVWDSSTVAAWHLSETSGHHANSTSTSSIDTTVENVTQKGAYIGKVGRADEFSGTSDDVMAPSSSSFRQAGDFTISAWVKADTLSSVAGHDQAILYRHLNASPYEEYGLYINDTNDKIHFTSASVEFTGGTAIVNTAISINTWYHVVGVKSGSNMKLYINGSNGGTTDGTYVGTYPNLTGDFFIGDYDSNNVLDFDGVIDEVRLSSTARSATWISTEYNNQSSPSTFFLSGISEEERRSAVVSFSFNEGFGTTTRDSSANALTGTLTGATAPAWKTEDLCVSGKCLYYQGTTAYTNVATSVPNVQSVSFWVKPKTNGETLVDFDGGTHYISASAGTITATGFASPTVYVNGISGAALVANVWQHVEVTTATAFTASNITIGKRASNFLNGFIDEFKVYDYARSAAQVKLDFNSRNSTDGLSAYFGSDTGKTLSSGLVGYWKMDESTWGTPNCSTDVAIDSSGNSNNGDACPNSTGPVGGTAGKFGNTVTFDGSDDYLLIADSSSLDLTANFTIGAWINPDTGSFTTDRYVISKDGVGTDTDDAYNFLLSPDTTNTAYLCYETNNRGVSKRCSTSAVVSTAKWSHIAMTFDNSTSSMVSLYVDGVKVADDGDTTQAPVALTTNLLIGRRGTAGNEFDGRIDEARIYNRSFSPMEITQLYNFAPGPVGYWKMDENTGTSTTYDSSGNGFNGTMTNISEGDWVPAKYGSGIDFDNANDNVSITDNDVFSANTSNQLTVETWFKPTDFSVASTQHLVSKGTGGNYEWSLSVNNDETLRARLYNPDGAGDYLVTSPFLLPNANTWYHIAMVADLSASSLKIYVNGVLFSEDTTTSGSYANSTAALRIGERADGNGDVTGVLDDVRIYNYVRTPGQIVEDMNGGRVFGLKNMGTSVAYWSFDEGTGTTANDTNRANGGAEDLTLNTASWTNNGRFGKAWNGTGGAVRVSRATDSDLEFSATEDLSLSLWFKSDSATNPAATEYLVNSGGAAGAAGYAIYANTSGHICFGIDDDASWGPDVASCTTTDFYDGNWHLINAVRNVSTDTTKIYIDTFQKDSDTDTTTATLDSSPTFYIGDIDTDDAGSGEEFAGDIDEVYVFRSALNDEQVKLLFNNGVSASIAGVSTDSSGNVDNSSRRSYCPPGNAETNCLSGDPSPLIEWKMDDNTGTSTTADTSANGYAGTMNGSMTLSDWVPGKYGSALEFDGVDDRIQNTSVTLPTGDFTYQGWIYPTTLGSSNVIFGAAQASIGGNELNIDVDTDGDIDVVLDNGTLVINGTNGLITTNNWYHIAVTRSGSAVTSYINGRADVTGTEADALSLAACGINVGSRQSSTSCSSGLGDYFAGKIDDVKVYNYARTQAQISWDYNKGAPKYWWKMDETSWTNNCSTDSVFDSSGNGKHGDACPNSTGPVGGGTGKLNRGGSFDGSNDYVQISSPALPTADFSYTAWFYVDDLSQDRTILMISDGSAGSEIILRLAASSNPTFPNKLEFGADGTTDFTTRTFQTGRWYHIAVTRSGSTIRLYTDGVIDPTTVSDSTTLSFSSCQLFIGLDVDTSGCAGALSDHFDGFLDDIRVYDYALSAAQVKTVMNDGSAHFAPVTGTP